MSEFRNWLHRVESSFRSDPGSPFRSDKLLQIVDGRYELIEVGKSNLYNEIQSHKDSCDIYKLLERFQAGDVSALSKVAGQYIDITEAPKTLAEAYTFIGNAEKFFSKLPLKLREEYDFDPSKFVSDLGSAHCNSLLSEAFGSSDSVSVEMPSVEMPFVDNSVSDDVIVDNKE